jgi:hypothetical protein
LPFEPSCMLPPGDLYRRPFLQYTPYPPAFIVFSFVL